MKNVESIQHLVRYSNGGFNGVQNVALHIRMKSNDVLEITTTSRRLDSLTCLI